MEQSDAPDQVLPVAPAAVVHCIRHAHMGQPPAAARIPDTAAGAVQEALNSVPEADRPVQPVAADQMAAGHGETVEVYMGFALASARVCHLLLEP